MECKNCGHSHDPSTAKFCSECATEYTPEDKLPWIGDCKDRGVFRITFAAVEGEFDHDDAATDAARHSNWNEDDEFPNFTLKKISSTVTAATHPYICGGCGDYVSEHTDGKCQGCDAQDWQLR
ncbi:hypothetical protein HOB10_01605 [Candidatus Parcubacteria bacterium]|jgi:NMD protein affecting ribosome stability and mRNA decay|nr:hypothetical protein [Candidatus Parcubacteria bacterium]